jgi:hypothetical protein
MAYRLYRLRRLVVLCLVTVLAGLAAGAWFAGFKGPLAQPAALAILFILSGGALVALALRWPRDIGGTLTFAVGTGVMLAAVVPFSIYMTATEDRQGLGMVLAVMFGPVVWLAGAPLIGAVLLLPLDGLERRNHTSTSRHYLPLPPDIAWERFSFRPGMTSAHATTGPVEWDGFWEERSVGLAPDPSTGKLIEVRTIIRIKELQVGDMSQSVMAVPQQAAAADKGLPTSFVIHMALSPDGDGTLMTRHTNMDRVSAGRLLTAWLSDSRADGVLAECDVLAGHPPRALSHLPQDSIWTALQRFFRWDDRPGF